MEFPYVFDDEQDSNNLADEFSMSFDEYSDLICNQSNEYFDSSFNSNQSSICTTNPSQMMISLEDLVHNASLQGDVSNVDISTSTSNSNSTNQLNNNNSDHYNHDQKSENVNEKAQNQRPLHKNKRREYPLSLGGQTFQTNLTKLFHRKVRKELIIKYHKKACQRNKNIKPLIRDAQRILNVYFETYAYQQLLILETLQQLILEGEINFYEDCKAIASLKKK